MKRKFHANFGDQSYRGGRGYTRYTYTLKDIANITGYKLSYIYKLKQAGKLVPGRLSNVVEFIQACTYRRATSQANKVLKKRANLYPYTVRYFNVGNVDITDKL